MTNLIGKSFQDPSGLVLGHVKDVQPDGSGSYVLTVHGDWGALDWLHSLGTSQDSHLFRFHTSDIEQVGDAVRLRPEVVAGAEARKSAPKTPESEAA